MNELQFLKLHLAAMQAETAHERVSAFSRIGDKKIVFETIYQHLKKDFEKPPIYYALSQEAKEIIQFSIIHGFMEIFQECLACENQKENISEFIDSFISTSIMYERNEMTAILIDWKYKNNLHTEKNWVL